MFEYVNLCKGGMCEVRRIPFHVCKKLTIIYIVSGRLRFTTVAGMQTLYEGQIEILNVKEPIMLEAEDGSCRILYFSFDDAFLEKMDMNFEWVTYNCNICNFFGAAAQKKHIDVLTSLVLRFMLDASEGIPQAEIESKANEILKYIVEHFDDVGHIFSESTGEDISKERFQRISSYMIANVTKKISLGDIAQHEYLSIPYLSKEFTAKLEKNYHAVINYYRTINAVIQLLDTDHTLTYIAETSGFSSVRYYNKVFSGFLGCLPSKFRSVYKGRPQEAADQKLDVKELRKIAALSKKQTDQTNIRILIPEDDKKVRCFTYSGYHEESQLYTFTIDGVSNAEKGVVLYIDDDLNRRVGSMAENTLSDESLCLQKLQGPRREVWCLQETETEIKTIVCGKWSVEIYILINYKS